MKHARKFFFFSVILISSLIGTQFFEKENDFQVFLDKSAPYIGALEPIELGFDGSGITIAVIDTGVDYTHPDLFGFGPYGKVIGGYDYVDNDDSPIDTNGHGTEVAGIIAADGQLQGIAPKSKILAYRVSQNGEAVSSDLIIKAIEQAVRDDADIINISLGVNLTNSRIDQAVNKAVEQGIVVVTAAGNHGPDLKTIGSPGINPNTITVGATYNNITSSLVATLEVGDDRYQVLPMVGTIPIDTPITSEIIFGKYGRERDLTNQEIKDSILLVERGSDVEDEIVYFSDKELNAAQVGALGIIVYNNIPGLFYGELIHEFAPSDYNPSIPAVSLSRGEGMKLKESLEQNNIGTLNVFYHPDFVAHFSSRGPVSPFYIKPDLVAPGAFVNTTLTDGKYNFTSGTSFAAPHVSGSAALLLQKKIDLNPSEIKSLIVTTSNTVTDAYGNNFPVEITGTGRLNVTQAFNANLIIEPTYLTFNLSPEKKTHSQFLNIKSIDGNVENLKISFIGNENIEYDYKIENGGINVTATLDEEFFGQIQDKAFIHYDGIVYNIPIISHITRGAIQVNEQNGEMRFEVLSSDDWTYAKISVSDKNSRIVDTTSVTPSKDGKITIYEPGLYWVEAQVRVDGETFEIYETANVESAAQNNPLEFLNILNIPERPILIIFGALVIIALVGLKIRK
jgi:minor extracellular serine protease Vpr